MVIEKVRRNKDRTSGGDSTVIDVGEVEKSFWLIRPDGWVVNRKMKKIILLEFKRTDDYSEAYYRDMKRVEEQHHTPILTGLRACLAVAQSSVTVLRQCPALTHLDLSDNNIRSDESEILAGVLPGLRGLRECLHRAQRWLTSTSSTMTSVIQGQRVLRECCRSAQRWFT